ncbi:MAG TPA: hypothetical protein PLD96_08320 [Methanothrix sp.]|nr:hypothetical protein [Methanothrix sp.]
MKLDKEEAVAFFREFYGGEHHFPSELKPYGEGWSMSHFGSMATFDDNRLTRLVILAHKHCIRAQIAQGGPNRLRIAIWKRKREGSLCERHPTMEQAIHKAGDLPAFREGDVRCLKALRGILQASIGPDTYSEELDCINRMIEAAALMEAAQR